MSATLISAHRVLDDKPVAALLASGVTTGAVYASLALALVMTHRSTGLVNLAQGEMAMFSAYIAWALTQIGLSYLAAFVITLAASFVIGVSSSGS